MSKCTKSVKNKPNSPYNGASNEPLESSTKLLTAANGLNFVDGAKFCLLTRSLRGDTQSSIHSFSVVPCAQGPIKPRTAPFQNLYASLFSGRTIETTVYWIAYGHIYIYNIYRTVLSATDKIIKQ